MNVLVVDLTDERLTEIEKQVLAIVAARLGDCTIRLPSHLTPTAVQERCRRALLAGSLR
jgi:hypothetical protein